MPQTVLTELKATTGAEEIIKKFPKLETPDLWLDTAYFSVCSKTGTAHFLDIWDARPFRRIHRYAAVREQLPGLVLSQWLLGMGIRPDEDGGNQLLLHRSHQRPLRMHGDSPELPDGKRRAGGVPDR